MSKYNVFLLFCLLSNSLTIAKDSENSFDIVNTVSNIYIKSFKLKSDPNDQLTPIDVIEKNKDDKKNASNINKINLDNLHAYRIIYNSILSKTDYVYEINENYEDILNKKIYTDLKLFFGTSSNYQYNLLNRISRTNSKLGNSVLSLMLANPTTDIEELKDKQRLIKHFYDDDDLSAQIDKYLQMFNQIENNIISFWSSTDPIYNKFYNENLLSKFYFRNKKKANKSAASIEFWKRCVTDFTMFSPLLLIPYNLFFSDVYGVPLYTRHNFLLDKPFTFLFTTYPISEVIISQYYDPTFFYLNIFTSIRTLGWISYSLSTYVNNDKIVQNVAKRVTDIKRFVYLITKIYKIIASDPNLLSLFKDNIKNIKKLIDQEGQKTELGRFLYYIKSIPTTNFSYLCNNTGKLFASLKIFIDNLNLFANILYELGYIDSLLSCSKLLNETNDYDSKNQYSFPQYIGKSKNGPYVNMIDMWNPFLDASKAVANNIEIGQQSKNQLRNMILTGPNAGGKSTYIVGITTAILLSQTLGISPTTKMIITPFDKINTYLDITDDISGGKSLFMAEVDRAQEHINLLKSLDKDEYCFSIFDEPFNATNHYEGSAAEYSILESIADYKNALNIVSTHYPIIMLLEEKAYNKGFRNYKVYITKNEQNKLVYYYKIVPGRSNQSIAIDILEEFGYDKSLIQRAIDIINHPEEYTISFSKLYRQK